MKLSNNSVNHSIKSSVYASPDGDSGFRLGEIERKTESACTLSGQGFGPSKADGLLAYVVDLEPLGGGLHRCPSCRGENLILGAGGMHHCRDGGCDREAILRAMGKWHDYSRLPDVVPDVDETQQLGLFGGVA